MSRRFKAMANKAAPLDRLELRPATQNDFAFARSLYMSSMQPLLTALDAWDAEKAENAFKGYFDVDEIRIITSEGADIGWMQVSMTDDEFCLDQIHLCEQARGKGIGAILIQDLIDRASAQGKDVTLSLVKGNPSIRLYERLGFQLTGEDRTKYHMRYSVG